MPTQWCFLNLFGHELTGGGYTGPAVVNLWPTQHLVSVLLSFGIAYMCEGMYGPACVGLRVTFVLSSPL